MTGDTLDPSDVDLLERIKIGDMAAFDAFYRRYENRVFRFVSRKSNDPIGAADILHETMMAIWKSAGHFEGRSSVSTWVFGIAYRKTMDHFRKHKREDLMDEVPEQVDDSPDQLQTLSDSETGDQISKCLDGLSPSHRAVINLAFFEDMAYPEISQVLDTAEGTVKTRVHYAKKLLRRCLESHGGLE